MGFPLKPNINQNLLIRPQNKRQILAQIFHESLAFWLAVDSMTFNKEKLKERKKGEKFVLQEENHFKYLLILPVALGSWQHRRLLLAGEGLLLGNTPAVAEISRFVLGPAHARKRGCDSQHKTAS